MSFLRVESGGKEVGYALPVFYPSFHDMEWHLLMGQLTSLYLKDGVQFNGFRILLRCRVGEYQNMVVVQPLQVEETAQAA